MMAELSLPAGSGTDLSSLRVLAPAAAGRTWHPTLRCCTLLNLLHLGCLPHLLCASEYRVGPVKYFHIHVHRPKNLHIK